MNKLFRFSHWGLVNIWLHSSFLCGFGQWFSYVTTFATQYTLVLFTADRFLAVFRPIYYKTNLRKRLTYPIRAVVCNFAVTSALLAGNFSIFRLEDSVCRYRSDLSHFWNPFYFHYTVTFLYCALPATCLFIMNISIIRR